MRNRVLVLAAILTFVCAIMPLAAELPPSGGSLSACLVGTWDSRNDTGTVLQIVNPTNTYLLVKAAFYDDGEKKLKMIEEKMSPNDLWEIDVLGLGLAAKFGVVKLISYGRDVPEIGIIGYQKQYLKTQLLDSTILQPVPIRYCGTFGG